jgi:8-oxo-dGTP diphosphatase
VCSISDERQSTLPVSALEKSNAAGAAGCAASDEACRRYPSHPFVGVGALIFDDGAHILLVERGREPLKGYWSIPGGIVETGEQLADGIRREVREETGLEVEILSVFEIFERIIPDAEGKTEYHYVLIDYLCRPISGSLRPASDATRAAWVSQPDLHNYRLTDGTREVIERAFGKLQR